MDIFASFTSLEIGIKKFVSSMCRLPYGKMYFIIIIIPLFSLVHMIYLGNVSKLGIFERETIST